MPNTPARLGKGMTVWYATPETTEEQRAQAAALLGALGLQLEVDDEKMVAMATAVSGTGPTYVFLVMEALIDAAVHLGFPRHVAHDLVIETLEGSTLFAKQSGMHPAELRNMVTSPGGTSAAALHELESGPPADRAVGGGLGGVPADRRARRPARGQPRRARREGSAHRDDGAHDRRRRSTFAGRPWRTSAPSTCVAPSATCGRTRPRSGIASSRRGPASTTPPGICPAPRRRTPAGPDWSLAEHIGHIADWQELAADYIPVAIGTGPLAVRRRLRRRRLRPLQRAPPGTLDDDVGRGHPRAPDRRPAARCWRRRSASTPETIRGHEAWGWVYFVLHGHYLDHLAVVEPWTDALRLRQVDGDPFVADPRAPDHAWFPRAGGRDRRAVRRARPDRPARPLERGGHPGLDPQATTWAISPTGPRKASAPSRSSTPAAPGWPIRTKASTPGMSATSSRRAARARTRVLARYDEARAALLAAVETLSIEDLRSPDGWSWAQDCLHGHVRKHLAMLGRWCARGRLARSLMPTDRSPGAATGSAGLTIEGIVAVESPREFRINPRERVVAYTVRGRPVPASCSRSRCGGPARRPRRSPRPRRRSANRSGRRTAGASRSSGTRRSGSSRPTGPGSRRWSPSPAAVATRSGRRTAGGSPSCRADAAGRRSG